MSKTIHDYMTKLATDPKAREAHRKDPDAEMKKFGLTQPESDIVASHNHVRIHEAVRNADPKLAETLAIIFG